MTDKTLDNYRDFVRGKYLKRNTRHVYIDHPKILLQDIGKPVAELAQDDITNYCTSCSKYKDNGNAIRFWSIRQFLTWAGRTDLNVPIISPVDAGKQALNEENTQRLLSTIERMPVLYKLVFYLEHDTLRRPCEIREIQLNDRDGDVLQYLGKTRNVNGRQRCFMTPRLMQSWDDYLLVRPLPANSEEAKYLILCDYGRYSGHHIMTNHPLTRIIREISLAAQIETRETPTNYLIKRTSITRQLKECNDPKLVQIQAGHSKLETTMKYNRISDEDMRNYVRLCESKSKKVNEESTLGDDKSF